MKRLLLLASLSLGLAACIDTTGISPESSRPIHPLSSPNAAVLVQEYADFQCPSCKAAHTIVVKPLMGKYGTQIRYEFMHFPLASIHRYAVDAAEASECAADQGKFWEFVDLAFEEQEKLSKNIFEDWGKKLGLDMDLYDRCRNSHIKRDGVLAEFEAGRKTGVGGTPTFFVNGQRVDSTLEALSTAIDAATTGAMQML